MVMLMLKLQIFLMFLRNIDNKRYIWCYQSPMKVSTRVVPRRQITNFLFIIRCGNWYTTSWTVKGPHTHTRRVPWSVMMEIPATRRSAQKVWQFSVILIKKSFGMFASRFSLNIYLVRVSLANFFPFSLFIYFIFIRWKIKFHSHLSLMCWLFIFLVG